MTVHDLNVPGFCDVKLNIENLEGTACSFAGQLVGRIQGTCTYKQ
jgi:hypothetical protein